MILHRIAHLVPLTGSDFVVDAFIAKNGKLFGVRSQVNQNTIAVCGFVHPQFFESFGRCYYRIGGLMSMADVNSNLCGSAIFRGNNTCNNFRFLCFGK